MSIEPWHCEGCYERKETKPDHIEKYAGVEGTVELWFCERCAL